MVMTAVTTFSVFIAMSLDGFIARRDGSLDWLNIVNRPGEDYGFKAFYDSVDALVLGRGTYETALPRHIGHAARARVRERARSNHVSRGSPNAPQTRVTIPNRETSSQHFCRRLAKLTE